MTGRRLAPALLLALSVRASAQADAAPPSPKASRAPERGCAWASLSDPKLGLRLLHQECDFGFKTITHDVEPGGTAVYEVWKSSDGKRGGMTPLIELYSKKAEETPEEALKRVAFKSLTRAQRKHCAVIRAAGARLGRGKAAYTIAPDDEYAAELSRRAGDEIPPPPCGPHGFLPDGFTYWEFHPAENPRRFAFVDFGQDEHPLFDETSLEFLP